MESELTCFAKMIDISNGSDIFLKNVRIYYLCIFQVPCVLGRASNSDNLNYKEKKEMIGKTIDIDTNYCNLSEINDYFVRHKLIIENCKRM